MPKNCSIYCSTKFFFYLFIFLLLDFLSSGIFSLVVSFGIHSFFAPIFKIWWWRAIISIILFSSFQWWWSGYFACLFWKEKKTLNDGLFFYFFWVFFLSLLFFLLYIYHSGNHKNTFPSDIFLQRVLVWCLCRPGQHSIGLKQVRLDGCLHLFFVFSLVLIKLTLLHVEGWIVEHFCTYCVSVCTRLNICLSFLLVSFPSYQIKVSSLFFFMFPRSQSNFKHSI